MGILAKGGDPGELARDGLTLSGYNSLVEIEEKSVQSAHNTVLSIDEATDQINADQGNLGVLQMNALESNFSTIRIEYETLIPSESTIHDIDLVEELVTITRNQIISESATAMSVQANLIPINVIALLG